EKISTLSEPGLTLVRVEDILRTNYAKRKAQEVFKGAASASPAPAPASNSHVLVVGGLSGGAGCQQGGSSNGQQTQQQQQWGGSRQQQQWRAEQRVAERGAECGQVPAVVPRV
ncbi:unnamed protein product, partial [Ectocarpus sp. 13 AM-2016]